MITQLSGISIDDGEQAAAQLKALSTQCRWVTQSCQYDYAQITV